MNEKIPEKTLYRFALLYRYLQESMQQGIKRISSRILSSQLGSTSDSIRKDINYLGEVGEIGAGYDVVRLKSAIEDACGYTKRQRVAVCGLGKIGSAFLGNPDFEKAGFDIVAGFDSSINVLETLRTKVPLFPASEMSDRLKRLNVTIGIIAVPPVAAQDCAMRFVAGGVVALVNFASATVSVPEKNVFVRNFDIIGELRYISSIVSRKPE